MAVFDAVPIERVREYWDRRPCNIRHSSREIGTREYFDEVEARKYFVEPHIPRFAEFPRWAGRRVLEIGCGIGTDTISFARAGAQVTAVDLSESSLEVARQRARVFGLEDRITFYQANAEQLDQVVPREPYDLVYSFGVIHHSPHPERIVEQVRQNYLAPGSYFKVMVYNHWSWKVLGILFSEAHGQFWRLNEAVARNSEAQTGCPVTYTYTRADVPRLLPGFEIVDVSVDHIFPYSIPEYVQYQYRKARPFCWLPDPAMRALEQRLGWHLCITVRKPGP